MKHFYRFLYILSIPFRALEKFLEGRGLYCRKCGHFGPHKTTTSTTLEQLPNKEGYVDFEKRSYATKSIKFCAKCERQFEVTKEEKLVAIG